ncbi:MAG: AAA family ATPase [Saprospiraceae bacterium]|nr:AAA family ATPase [Saprospiraceae bacterium]
MLPEAAPLLYRELIRIATHPDWAAREKVLALAGLQERLFFEATKQEQLAFSTLFARISYAGHLYQIQPDTLRLIHAFRRTAARVRAGYSPTDRDVRLGLKAIAETVLIVCQTALPGELLEHLPAADEWRFAPPEIWDYKARARVVAVRDEPEKNYFLAYDDENPGQPVRVRYQLPDRNDNFNPSIRLIRSVFGFPVTLNLLEVDIDRQGDYRPRVFVIEPDYLVDVTAVAESFKADGAQPLAYLVKKFLPYELTPAILLGNIANFFLDRLLNEPNTPFPDLLRETFQLYPFVYAPMADSTVRDISGKAQKHYLNLQSMARQGLARQQIDPENCVLEPTFYSEQYGLQGRLDLFYQTSERSAIVELKSGTPFQPNSYGIQRSHFTQTLLYDLLVRSVFGAQTDPAKYILYSGADVQHLRFAPTVAPEQWEALQVRNHLVGIERLLAAIRPGELDVPLLQRLRSGKANSRDFLARDFGIFELAYAKLSVRERKYVNAFVGFIAREQWLAKVGEENSDALNGNASLWRSSLAEKQDAFSILSHLEIADNQADQPEPGIIFKKTEKTNPLANFRVGDIAVLYPAETDTDTVLDHQVIKCTITELGKDRVRVQLRYRQFNLKPFATDSLWTLEPDMLETGFVTMYRGLFEWASAPPGRRQKVLGPEHPAATAAVEPPEQQPLTPQQPAVQRGDIELSAEQADLLRQITASQDFFLLWGPPGTGKTSVMLRALADWVLRETSDNLLLMAYTNRAVDEICEALDSLGGNIRDQYLRIGSRYSTAERFRDQLLHGRIAGAGNRAELRAVLEPRRIIVSTVASFAQNDKLLDIKKFQRLIVDEASQILEPQLVGLLTRFEHYVLVGDHRQLPAVTAQQPEQTRVEDPDLNAVGLTDLRDSYFERLYRQCTNLGLRQHYGRLSHQGRMHADLMDFPNRHFYSGLLQTMPGAADHQHRDLPAGSMSDAPGVSFPDGPEPRVLFVPVVTKNALPNQKTAAAEAEKIAQWVVYFKKQYETRGKTWRPDHSLGIITPWRAQIAQLRQSIAEAGLDPDLLSIDTVERYQGGARDIILISCCVHSLSQLSKLVNLSGEGVDRKLNVALTRAREQVLVFGNPEVLREDDRYRDFIDRYLCPNT